MFKIICEKCGHETHVYEKDCRIEFDGHIWFGSCGDGGECCIVCEICKSEIEE